MIVLAHSMELEIKELVSDNARSINPNSSRAAFLINPTSHLRPGEGCVLLAVPVHGLRGAELGVPGVPHLHRVHAGQEGAHVRAAGAPRDVHHHHHAGDRPV